MTVPERRTIAVYPGPYLDVSKTFIHRQLLGAAATFRPIVLTDRTENLERFPFEPIYVCRRSRSGTNASGVLRRLFGKYRLLTPSQLITFGRILHRERVALVHAHFGPGGLDMLPLARFLGIPLLVTFHGFDASRLLRDPRYCRSLRELFRYADVITVSALMRDRLVRYGADPSRTRVHYIGAPVEDFSFERRRSLSEKVRAGEMVRFLQVSNFVEKKGHAYTIEAFAEVALRHPNCRLTLAGDGPLREAIEQRARELGVSDRVSLPGKVWKQQVIALMAEADVFLHHSVTDATGDEEGIPTVIMEAMATGLPVVSTLHAGIPELIEDGVTGLLVAERDVAAYGRAMERLLVEGGEKMGELAAAAVRERFDLSMQNRALLRIYEEIVDRRPRR